jgi:hypothetical protein
MLDSGSGGRPERSVPLATRRGAAHGLVPAAALLTLLAPQVARAEAAAGVDAIPFNEFLTLRLDIDNDIVFDSDDQFSHGASFEMYGKADADWTAAEGTPAFGKPLARWFLPERDPELLFREGWIVGQDLQTPEDLRRETLIVDDVPYAALLAIQNSWIGFSDERLAGFGWILGVVGPLARGEDAQEAVHRVLDLVEPRGWDNQLENEPILNLYYQRKRKLWAVRGIDLSSGLGAQAGNLLIGADAELEARFGWNIPGGFLYIPDPTGRSLAYDAHLAPPKPARRVLYGSLVLRALGVGRNLFLDGNTFRDSHGVDRRWLVGEMIAGLHYQRRRWGVHVHVWLSTDTVDPGGLAHKADTKNQFGSLMFEYRRP